MAKELKSPFNFKIQGYVHTHVEGFLKEKLRYVNNKDFKGLISFTQNGDQFFELLTPVQFGPVLFHGDLFKGKITTEGNTLEEIGFACTPLKNLLREAAVVVRQGRCPLIVKAAHAQAAGARIMLIIQDKVIYDSNSHSSHTSSRLQSIGGIERIEIPAFLVTEEIIHKLRESDYNNVKISSILSTLTKIQSVIKPRLQFRKRNIMNILVHSGELTSVPMDYLYRNDYHAIPFTFITRHRQCFEFICKL